MDGGGARERDRRGFPSPNPDHARNVCLSLLQKFMSSPDQIVSLLEENDAFSGCSKEVLEELAVAIEERTVPAKTVLIEKGAKGGDVFVASAGEFGVFLSPDATEPAVRLGRGAVFGEIGAVSGIEATATVSALREGRVLTIPGAELHSAMRRSPELAASILRSLSRYLGKD